MEQMLVASLLLLVLWLQVLAPLWGLIDVAQSRYEDKADRILGLALMSLYLVLAFGLALFLTPILETAAYKPLTPELSGGVSRPLE